MYVFLALSEKTRKYNRLQMSLQRQYFLLSPLIKDPECWFDRGLNLPHSTQARPTLSQLSYPSSSGDIYCFTRRLIVSPKVAKRMIDYRECSVIGLYFSCRKKS